MANIIYSTHYAGYDTNRIWLGRLSRFFQIKEEGLGSCAAESRSPSWEYELGDFDFGEVDIIDYDTARHWPHP